MKRRPAPWWFWLWSGCGWLLLASAVFRGEATGSAASAWDPGAGTEEQVIADGPSGPTPGPATLEWGSRPDEVADPFPAAARAGALAERSSGWGSLRKELRQSIDRQAGAASGWRRLVVEESGDPSGNAADLAFRSGGLDAAAPTAPPHFVIGNGSRSGDGWIEPTGRALTGDSLRILLIGDFRAVAPTASQLRSLTGLIDYLRAKTGMIPVQAAAKPGVEAGAVPQEMLDVAYNQTLTARSPVPERIGTE